MIRQPAGPLEEETNSGSWSMWWVLVAGLVALGIGLLVQSDLHSGEAASIGEDLYEASLLFVLGWFVWFLVTIRSHIRRGVDWTLSLAGPGRTGYLPSVTQTRTLLAALFGTALSGLAVLLAGAAISQDLEGCRSQYFCVDPGGAVALAGASLLVFAFFVPAVLTRLWAHTAAGAPSLPSGPSSPVPAPVEEGRTQRACLSCLRVIPISDRTCPFCGALQV